MHLSKEKNGERLPEVPALQEDDHIHLPSLAQHQVVKFKIPDVADRRANEPGLGWALRSPEGIAPLSMAEIAPK